MATRKYVVDIWWTVKAKYDQVVNLEFNMRAKSDAEAQKLARSTFDRVVNRDAVKIKDPVQLRVRDRDGRMIENVSFFLEEEP